MPTNLEVKAKLTNKERAIEAAKQLSNSQGILLVSFKQAVHLSIYTDDTTNPAGTVLQQEDTLGYSIK